jgi:hypothetical protein
VHVEVTKQPDQSGPGRSTSDAAIIALKKEIAQRTEQAERQARTVRTARDKEQARRRRQGDFR